MKSKRAHVLVVGLIFTAHLASAQDMSTYRAYVLESSLKAVVLASGARASDTKTLHERPAVIQSVEWRRPYVDARSASADPVRDISFTFYNDALYQVTVIYDRTRTEGLTDSDIVESLSTEYGVPAVAPARRPTSPAPEEVSERIVVARWENADSLLTLSRGTYTPDFQLILVSKRVSALAGTAVREAVRLDGIDAPRREAARRTQEADDALAARDKTRVVNKAAFRP